MSFGSLEELLRKYSSNNKLENIKQLIKDYELKIVKGSKAEEKIK